MNRIIRDVRSSDTEAINCIYNDYVVGTTISFETKELTVNEMRARIEQVSRYNPYYVCEVEGSIVGFCYSHLWRVRTAYSNTNETTIYVAPEFKRMGIGTELMRRLLGECRNRGVHALIACITAGNIPSIELHKRLGFKQVSFFPEVGMKFGRYLDVVDYELLLNEESSTKLFENQ